MARASDAPSTDDGQGKGRSSERRRRMEQRRQADAMSRKTQAGHKAERTGFRQFVRECIAELRKVQWPTRSQLWQATGVVILVTIIVGLYIAALDSVFVRASEWLIDQYAQN